MNKSELVDKLIELTKGNQLKWRLPTYKEQPMPGCYITDYKDYKFFTNPRVLHEPNIKNELQITKWKGETSETHYMMGFQVGDLIKCIEEIQMRSVNKSDDFVQDCLDELNSINTTFKRFKKVIDDVYDVLMEEYDTDNMIWHFREETDHYVLYLEPIDFNADIELLENVIKKFDTSDFTIAINDDGHGGDSFIIEVLYYHLPLRIYVALPMGELEDAVYNSLIRGIEG